jgi:hypothetical protein
VVIEGSATDVVRIENSGPDVAVMESALDGNDMMLPARRNRRDTGAFYPLIDAFGPRCNSGRRIAGFGVDAVAVPN